MRITINNLAIALDDDYLLGLCEAAWESWIQGKFKTYCNWTVKLFCLPENKSNKWALGSACTGNNVEVAAVTVNINSTPAKLAAKLKDILFDREFPLHVEMKKKDVQTLIVSEFLDFIRDTKGFHFSEYHKHTAEECGTKFPYQCGRCDGTLYDVHASNEDLMFEFFGIDKQAFLLEKDRMLAWIQ